MCGDGMVKGLNSVDDVYDLPLHMSRLADDV